MALPRTISSIYDVAVLHPGRTKTSKPRFWRRFELKRVGLCWFVLFFCGCGDLLPPQPAQLLTIPITLSGLVTEPAIVDTGGGYELMLRQSFGLDIVDQIEVIAFGGRETVDLATGFSYQVGNIETTADIALIGLSVCDCNGLGFLFFRKTGIVLGIDFPAQSIVFLNQLPRGGIELDFDRPPDHLLDFDSAFLDVDVTLNEETRIVSALIDTGTNSTIMRRGLFESTVGGSSSFLDVTVGRFELGTVGLRATLFDNPGLPDLVIGTDVMAVWGDRWYFSFTPRGGALKVFPRADESMADASATPQS